MNKCKRCLEREEAEWLVDFEKLKKLEKQLQKTPMIRYLKYENLCKQIDEQKKKVFNPVK